jgi:hypothetical protein
MYKHGGNACEGESMFTEKGKKPYSHLFKLLIVAFVLALASISVLSSTDAYAATGKKNPKETVGAELIIKGKVFKLTPVSSANTLITTQPNATQNCAFVTPSETNISNGGTAAYFNYSLRIYNVCANKVAVTRGTWSAQGSIDCDGTWYNNEPNNTGNVPSINSGKSALVQDQIPYEALCLGVIGGIIPYTYAPSEIQIVTTANGSLSNKNTWSDSQEDYFNP